MTSPSTPDRLLEFEAPRRHRLRIALTLAAFLVAVVLVGLVVVGWCVAGDHLMAASRFRSLSATVDWRWDSASWRNGIATSVYFPRGAGTSFAITARVARITDQELTDLKKLLRVEMLDLSPCSNVTDDGLVVLEDLPDLKELYLGGIHSGSQGSIRVGDRGVAHVARLTKLETLSLAGTSVTDGGLKALEGLASLKSLDLEETPITNAGLKSLRGLTNLSSLDLEKTPITDAGLKILEGLPQLQAVDLRGTSVTEEGVRRFKKALSGAAAVMSDFADESHEGPPEETMIDAPFP
jgi:hypothetical protein